MSSILYSNSGKVLQRCPSDFSKEHPVVTVPEGVTTIIHDAFRNNFYLKEIIFPESLRQIGSHAFADCSSLERVKLPSGMTRICANTFEKCTNLKTVILPETLEKIGRVAFYGCESLQSITLPDGLHYLDNSCFDNCINLQEILYRGLKIHINFKRWHQVSYLSRTLQFIQTRDFSMPIDSDIKYDLLWQMFQQTPDDTELRGHIQRNFRKLFLFLIKQNRTEMIQEIIKDGNYLTKHNIQRFILYANQHKHYEAQVLLMDFQSQNGLYKQKNLFL